MRVLLASNLIDTALVTTAFKLGSEEDVNQFNGFLGRDIVSRQTDDIGIVVLASEASQWLVPAKGSSNTLVVVAGHGDTIAC